MFLINSFSKVLVKLEIGRNKNLKKWYRSFKNMILKVGK